MTATVTTADAWVIDSEPDPRYPHYSRANVGEVLPLPVSPLNWTLVWERAILPGWRDGQVGFGILRPDELPGPRPPFVAIFAGHLYLNLSTMRLVGARMPGMTVADFDRAICGDHPDTPPYEPHPDDECAECTQRLAERLGWVLSATTWPELDEARRLADEARAGRPDLAALTDSELMARAEAMLPLLRRSFALLSWGALSAPVGPGILASITAALGASGLAGALITAVGDVDSAAPTWALWEASRLVRGSGELSALFDGGVDGLLGRLTDSHSAEAAAFLDRFSTFQADFGSRGPNEWDIASDSWETHPDLVLAHLERMRLATDDKSPQAGFNGGRAEREAAATTIRAKLAGDAETAASFEAALASAGNFMAWRERTKTVCVKVLHEIRLAMRELGRRAHRDGSIAAPADLMLLTAEELEQFLRDPQGLRVDLDDRRLRYRSLFDIEPFFFVSRQVPPVAEWARRADRSAVDAAVPGEELSGVPGSSGVARGRARVVTDPSDPTALEPGDVLVAPITDPSWTPLFLSAAAVVVDTGAVLSHAVIVCRELGIPCVTSVKDATRRIPDGVLVEVDGTTGRVRILAEGDLDD